MANDRKRNKRLTSDGLTLVELLIGLVIISILIIAGVSLVISSLRIGSRVEAFLRLQSKWSLLQYLLNNEIQESIAANAGSGSISLSIPYGDPPSCTTLVTYSLSGSTITRFGPGVNTNGSLVLPSCTTASVTATTQTLLTSVTSFSTSLDTSSSQRVSYSLSFSDPSGVQYSNKATSATGSARIIN